MEKLTVILPTYNRHETLRKTIEHILWHLKYRGEILFLVGDDSDDSASIVANKNLEKIVGYNRIKVLDGPKRGLGANLNMLIKEAKTDVILQMDDDHHLVKPLDINQFVKDLIEFSDGKHTQILKEKY